MSSSPVVQSTTCLAPVLTDSSCETIECFSTLMGFSRIYGLLQSGSCHCQTLSYNKWPELMRVLRSFGLQTCHSTGFGFRIAFLCFNFGVVGPQGRQMQSDRALVVPMDGRAVGPREELSYRCQTELWKGRSQRVCNGLWRLRPRLSASTSPESCGKAGPERVAIAWGECDFD